MMRYWPTGSPGIRLPWDPTPAALKGAGRGCAKARLKKHARASQRLTDATFTANGEQTVKVVETSETLSYAPAPLAASLRRGPGAGVPAALRRNLMSPKFLSGIAMAKYQTMPRGRMIKLVTSV